MTEHRNEIERNGVTRTECYSWIDSDMIRHRLPVWTPIASSCWNQGERDRIKAEALKLFGLIIDDSESVLSCNWFNLGADQGESTVIHLTPAPPTPEEANETKWQIDDCPDSNGFTTIRIQDAGPHGDTSREPIATVYNDQNAPVIAASPELRTSLESLCRAVRRFALIGNNLSDWPELTQSENLLRDIEADELDMSPPTPEETQEEEHTGEFQKLESGFMTPDVWQGSCYRVETSCGSELIQSDLISNPEEHYDEQSEEYDPEYLDSVRMFCEGDKIQSIELVSGWFARLSASGFMDQTGLSGPYDSRKEAESYLINSFGQE